MNLASSDPQESGSTLAPSKYVFFPITEVTTQRSITYCDTLKVQSEEEHTEVTFSTSFDIDDDDCSIGRDVLAPYPAYTKSSEEIRERKELELSFGENWSLQLAGEHSSYDMSVDETTETELGDDDVFCIGDIAEERACFCSTTQAPQQDSDEIRRKRNLLWKQSLKSSLFIQRR